MPLHKHCLTCQKSLWRGNKTGYCRAHVPQSGEHNPFYGKTFSSESRQKIAQGAVKRRGKQNGMWGGHTIETRLKQSQLAKQRIQERPELLDLLRKNAVVASTKTFRITKPQRAVERWLQEQGIPYTINGLIGGYSYDFRLDSLNVVIEVQGTYWHADPRFYGDGLIPLTERQHFKVGQDVKKKKLAIDAGFDVVYIWEFDIKRHDFSALETVENAHSHVRGTGRESS